MKYTFHLIFAAALLVFAACTKEGPEQPNAPDQEQNQKQEQTEAPFEVILSQVYFDIYPLEDQTVEFQVRNCTGDVTMELVSATQTTEIGEYSYDPSSMTGSIRFTMAQNTTASDHAKLIFRGIAGEVTVPITVRAHQASTNLSLTGDSLERSYTFLDYARIFDVTLNGIYHNLKVEVTGGEDWVQVHTLEWAGQTIVKIFVAENTSDRRDAQVRFSAPVCDDTVTLNITQCTGKPEESFTGIMRKLYNETGGNELRCYNNGKWDKPGPFDLLSGKFISPTVPVGNTATTISAKSFGLDREVYYGDTDRWTMILDGVNGQIPDGFRSICKYFTTLVFNMDFYCSAPASNLLDSVWHPNLEYLQLQDYTGQLNVTISDKILQCKNLEVVFIDSPTLNGYIPEGISQLKKLNELSLCNCAVAGVVPPELFTMPSMEYLRLDGNSQGRIPSDLSGLTSLTDIILRNNMDGIVPETLATLPKIEYIELEAGFEIVPEFFRYFGTEHKSWNLGRSWSSDGMPCFINMRRRKSADSPERILNPIPGWFQHRYGTKKWYAPTKLPEYPYADDLQYPADEYYYDGKDWRHPNYEHPAREYWFDGIKWVHDPDNPWAKYYDHNSGRVIEMP